MVSCEEWVAKNWGCPMAGCPVCGSIVPKVAFGHSQAGGLDLCPVCDCQVLKQKVE